MMMSKKGVDKNKIKKENPEIKNRVTKPLYIPNTKDGGTYNRTKK